MNMPMTGSNGIFTIPSEHVPGLIALVCLPIALLLGTKVLHLAGSRGSAVARRLGDRIGNLTFPAKVAVVTMMIGAAVHAAIVPTHWADSRVMAILFVADAAGFVGAIGWTLSGRRHWSLLSAAMLGGTVAGYALYLARGWETADPVGMITSAVELAGFLVVALAGHSAFAQPQRRLRLLGGSTAVALATVAATVLATSPATVASASSAPNHVPAMGSMGTGTSAGTRAASSSGMAGMTPDGAPASGSAGSDPNGMTDMGSPAPSGSSMPSMPPTDPSDPGAMSGMGATGAPNASGAAGMSGGMGGTAGGSGGSSGHLSLATTSPAGNITWPLPMGSMEQGMQMVTPDCTAPPTRSQQNAAVTLVDQTVSATARFQSLAAAKAAGYVAITPPGMPVVHYVDPAYLANPQLLDPGAIQSLVYANTSHGAVLVAAMYTMANDQVGQTPPMPGGCLTEWHVHTNLCFSDATHAVVGVLRNGSCPAGSSNRTTQPMIHVWLAPVPGGPLAVDASSQQIVAAAGALPAPNPANGTA